jgi:hypothetical protein
MTRLLHRLALIFLFCALGTAAQAATVSASSCSSSEIQNAINSASAGDTINIPAGSCSWSNLTINKPITLQGAGSATAGTSCPLAAATRITVSGSGTVSIIKQTSGPIRIKGIGFEASGGGASNFPIHVGGDWQGTQPVIFQNVSSCVNGTGMVELEVPGGVIFSHLYSVGGNQDNAFRVHGTQDSISWRTNDTMGSKDTSGLSNIYVEDSSFYGHTNGVTDADAGARIVFRHNTFTYGGFNSHGYDTSYYGLRHFEFYDNKFLDPNPSLNTLTNVVQFIWVRGGTGVIYNNYMDDLSNGTWGTKPEVRLNIRAAADPSLIGMSCGSINYSIKGNAGQVGQNWGNGNFFTDPVYFWGNTGSWTSPVSADFGWTPQCSYPFSTFFQWGRDGVNSAMQGGSPKPGYAAFTYPHPLVGSSGGSSGPTAPTALQAVAN